MSATDLSELSMADLFRLDAEGQIQVLTAGLLALERNPAASENFEACMRAAHSLKGAARIAGIDEVVRLAHVMEDCFVGAQRGAIALRGPHVDVLLKCVDLLHRISTPPGAGMQEAAESHAQVDALLAALSAQLADPNPTMSQATPVPSTTPAPAPAVACAPMPAIEPVPVIGPAVVSTAAQPHADTPSSPAEEYDGEERVLRVTAGNLNRLLGLAGESMVESRWLKPFGGTLLRLKRLHERTERSLDAMREALTAQGHNERTATAFNELRDRSEECRQQLAERLLELETFDARSTNLAHRLYDSALACRMRPFSAGVKHLPRLVRDLGRSLGKQVRLEIIGDATQVDRDILEKLDAPLGHLLRNALDHGIESAQERTAAGKPPEGVIRLEARHSAGLLQISASDDGRGVDLDVLRHSIVERRLTTAEVAARLDEAELLEFLFLPGFSTKTVVTEISGRGVGLDVVQHMIKQVRGSIRIFTQLGKGTRFQLQLPLTLSVVRTLLVQIGGEPYAFPLVHVIRTLKVSKKDVHMLEGREHFNFEGQPVGLVGAQQIFGGSAAQRVGEHLSVIMIGDPANPYGLVTDRFLGERELVVQKIDPRLGKIKDIAAAALMEDGSPVLIVDIEDMLRSVDKLVAVGRLNKVESRAGAVGSRKRKRVLVVEDSLTVRELERKLLDHAGYEVEVTVDGMDGWNTLRVGEPFDLVVTDIDMPRMDGIELVKLIKNDPKLSKLPVLIVSYKDREEDRRRGLEAGADYYVTKGSFQDDTLLRAVGDLIGEAA